MEQRKRWIEPRPAIITATMAAIIIYGSLYPFEFQRNANPQGPVRSLLATWRTPPGRGDLVANILLYLPLGLFFAQTIRRRPAVLRVIAGTLLGCALSAGMELAQFYDPGRMSAMSDVYANTFGAFLGSAASATLLRHQVRLPVLRKVNRRPFVLLLVACWLGYRLFPYVPAIDLHKYWGAIKPLIFSPRLPVLDVYRHTAAWLALALLLEALVGVKWSRVAVVLCIPAVLFARIVIVSISLSPAEIAGGAVGAVLWTGILSRMHSRPIWIAALFTGAVLLQGFAPFRFSSAPQPFGWMPFTGFLYGPLDTSIPSFLEKAFTYGTLIWVIARAGCRSGLAAVTGALLVFGISLMHIYVPGRSAEITDTLMAAVMALMMKLMAEEPREAAVE